MSMASSSLQSITVLAMIMVSLVTSAYGDVSSVVILPELQVTDSPIFTSTKTLSSGDCARLCLQFKACLSFNYNLLQTLCDLHQVVLKNATMQTVAGVVFSEASGWNPGVVGVCSSKPCGTTEMCIPRTTTSYNCVPVI